MLTSALYIILGLFAGTFSGLVGIGGGVLIVPALVFLFGFTQHSAQGTTLALLIPPIGFLAAYTYFKAGYVDLRVGALICIGFFIGGLLGSRVAVQISDTALTKVFACVLIAVGLYMFIKK